MEVFLLASNNTPFIERHIKNIKTNLHVSPVNLIEINPATSILISDVRKITQLTALKPYGGGNRLIIIYGLEKATLEAGNALLKILEEPPQNTYIILVCENINKLLPTIVSRCLVITDKHKTDGNKVDTQKVKKILRQILTSSAGERIIFSQKTVNTREEAILLVNNLLLTLEELLHKPDKMIPLSPKEIASLATKTSAAKNYLERYINFKATVDILLLGFPKIDKNLS